MHIEVISERCHIADKSYEKYNIFVQIDPWSRGVVWDITLGNIIIFQKTCFNVHIFGYIVSVQNLKGLYLL